jgi:adenylate cyclase
MAIGLGEAFAAETRRGARLSVAVYIFWSVSIAASAIISAVIASGFPAFFRIPALLSLEGIIAVVLPVPFYFIALRSNRPLTWCFVCMICDILIWAQGKFFWFSMPAIFAGAPLYLEVRFGDIISFVILLTIYILPLSQAFIAWGGAAVLAVWTTGIVHAFLSYKHATLYWGPLGSSMSAHDLTAMMDPQALVPDIFIIQILLVTAYVGFLMLSIQRGRRYVTHRVAAAADAAFLERFFPPDLAVEAARPDALTPVRREVAVLFMDVRDEDGALAESLARMQRRLGHIEKIVFANDGILDRFTGGPIMATFGALHSDSDAVGKALRCAHAITGTMLPDARGRIFIALHADEAICGDVGGTQSRLFSVVSDGVNFTRRILDAAKDRGKTILASDDFIAKLLPGADVIADPLAEVALRGREAPAKLWSVMV